MGRGCREAGHRAAPPGRGHTTDIADLRGFSIGKAVRWAEMAGDNWMTYTAAKQPRPQR